MVDVFLQLPGASADEVERRLVSPLEKALFEIPGVEYVYSTSQPSGGMLIVRFKVGTDPDRAALARPHQARRAGAGLLPAGAPPPLVVPRGIDDVPVVAYTLWSTTASPLELRQVGAGGRAPSWCAIRGWPRSRCSAASAARSRCASTASASPRTRSRSCRSTRRSPGSTGSCRPAVVRRRRRRDRGRGRRRSSAAPTRSAPRSSRSTAAAPVHLRDVATVSRRRRRTGAVRLDDRRRRGRRQGPARRARHARR